MINTTKKKTILQSTRANVAQKFLILDGNPLSFAAVPYMAQIMDCEVERKLMKTGRQVGKSTEMAADLMTDTISTPHNRSLYVAPRNEQVMAFSNDRLAHMIQYSPVVQDFYVDSSVQQQVKAKEFKNGSMIFLRSCYHTADGIRGLSLNKAYIDEVQDIIADNIPIIEECTYRKNPRGILYGGTPKTFDNTIEQLWTQTTQHHWAIKCEGCGKWNYQLGIEHMGPEFLWCSKCHTRLDPLLGEYVANYPDRDFAGFHVSQLMLAGTPGTGVPWSRVYSKLHDPMYGTAKVYNECLGYSYDSGAKPVTETELIACCDPERPGFTLQRKSDWNIKQTVAAIDWGVPGGNTHTVLTVGGLSGEGKLRVMYARKFPIDQDPTSQIDDIVNDISTAGCALVVADRGGGHVANDFLKKKLTWARVAEIEYKAKVTKGMYFNPQSGSWITDRTRAIAGIIIDIKSQNMIFPDGIAMKPYFTDILSWSAEYNDRLRHYQIIRALNVPDDFGHTLVYLRLGAKKLLISPRTTEHSLEDWAAWGTVA